MPTLVISADDCINALVIMGFTPVWRLNGRTLLASGDRTVTVPHALDPHALARIVESAAVSRACLLDLLGEGSGDGALGNLR